MNKINFSSISSTLVEEEFEEEINWQSTGLVVRYGDGVAWIYGLENAFMGEVVIFENDVFGMILSLENPLVGVVIFDDESSVSEDLFVSRTELPMTVPVGEDLCGRVIDAIGNPIDDLNVEPNADEYSEVEIKAPGIIDRQKVDEPLQTGILSIDSIFPIGKGQRELIIGDRQMGKTTIAVDTIMNQRSVSTESEIASNVVYSIYVAVGQRRSAIARLVNRLKEENAMSYTVVVSATASDAAALQFLAPYSGSAIGEWFRDIGEDALIIHDDLSKHAVAYRQISLLLGRPPGREAYPGDIFYLHSRLLERAAKMSDNAGAGSLTALPIVETQAGDVSGYIPTNVISITDGQLFLDSELFYSNILPAISIGLSVSRIGSAAQPPLMKAVSGSLKLNLALFKEIEAFTMMDAEIDDHTRGILDRGQRLIELLKQKANKPMPVEYQIILIYAGTQGFFDKIAVNQVSVYKEYIVNDLKQNYFNDSFYLAIDVNDNKINDKVKQYLTNVVSKQL